VADGQSGGNREARPTGTARAALRNRPWEHSTGPRTPEGKAKAAANGRARKPTPERGRPGVLELLAGLTESMGNLRRLLRR
jgi:hypothetical protein